LCPAPLTPTIKWRWGSAVHRRFSRRDKSSSSSNSSAAASYSNTAGRNDDNDDTDDCESDESEFLTNGGTVEGVWMFCRHGDRAPGRCLSPSHRRAEESAYWMSKLPYPDSEAAFESFSTKFPLDVRPGTNHGDFLDVKRNPYGFLTQKGIQQLQENGRKFFKRYDEHGHHCLDEESSGAGEGGDVQRQHRTMRRRRRRRQEGEIAGSFLSEWDLSVYSTNYLRTVLSVQSFLDGLLSTNLFRPTRTREYDANVIKEDRIPNHSSYAATEHNDDEALVKVRIRDLSCDPLNAFDRNPDLIAELVSEVMLSTDFLKRDAAAAPLAARLANVLPGLIRPFRTDFSHRAPSGINWVEASDHFICRASHGLDFSRFTDFEHDDRVEATLASMSQQTLTHLAWRFRKWYQNERLLAAIAAPPLREVQNHISATKDLADSDKRPFVVYSCHDITILGLLYGIGAEFLADDRSAEWRFWPVYGSHLVFELVRLKEGPVSRDSHVVRVLLNGSPIITVDHATHAQEPTPYLGSGPDKMLLLSDFENKVLALEEAGGDDAEKWLL